MLNFSLKVFIIQVLLCGLLLYRNSTVFFNMITNTVFDDSPYSYCLEASSFLREDILRNLPPDVADWSVNDVCHYIKSHGFPGEAKLFEEQVIVGPPVLWSVAAFYPILHHSNSAIQLHYFMTCKEHFLLQKLLVIQKISYFNYLVCICYLSIVVKPVSTGNFQRETGIRNL